MLFADRVEAGQKLAAALKNVSKQALVLAIPRGGIVVGYQIAQAHKISLDIVVTKKIGTPGNPELAIGAIAEDGTFLADQRIIGLVGATQNYINDEIRRQKTEIERRIKQYRNQASPPQIEGRDIIIVDDGVATGSTLKVAIQYLRHKQAKTITVAVPVGPPDTIRALQNEADHVICLATPEPFYAIGEFYGNFEQTTDQEVIELLSLSRKEVTAWNQ